MDRNQKDLAAEMRRSARVVRETGLDGCEAIAEGNDEIADYIEGLECGLAAERKLSARRTEQRDAKDAEIARLRGALFDVAMSLHLVEQKFASGGDPIRVSLSVEQDIEVLNKQLTAVLEAPQEDKA